MLFIGGLKVEEATLIPKGTLKLNFSPREGTCAGRFSTNRLVGVVPVLDAT